MKLPKMILFDYGQTLVNEQKFDGIKGTEAILEYAAVNKYHLTAEQVQQEAVLLNQELGKFDPMRMHLVEIEVPNTMFSPYLYESQGIEIPLSTSEIDRIFWDAASPGVATKGMKEFLTLLKKSGIRTGVISNISYAQEIVAERINSLLPENKFEFILTSSNYIFRKPNRRIFELALEKADLKAEVVWYIGDQLECDIKGAAGVGITPIWYLGAIDVPKEIQQNDVFTITDWWELQEKLEELLEQK